MIDILTWMHNIGIAILTILISVAIFIIQDKKRKDWDELVMIDRVINVKKFSSALMLIFVPILFWNINNMFSWYNIIIFVLFCIGVIYCIVVLYNIYKWIKAIEIEGLNFYNYRTKLRIEYLKNIKNSSEKKSIWNLIFKNNNKDMQEELVFLDIFVNQIKQMIEDNKFKEALEFIKIFSREINNLSISDWREFDLLFPFLLNWHFDNSIQYNTNDKGLVFETKSVLEKCILKFIVAALHDGTSYLLFEYLKKHVEKINISEPNKEKYLFHFFSIVSPVLFENIKSSPEDYDIWDEFFPSEWKITLSNLKTNNFAPLLWENFWSWSRNRIINPTLEYDFILEDVARELFPETDPILWADVLRFLCLPWYNDDRIGSIIKQKKNFGMVGRVISHPSRDINKIILNNTIELALFIGNNQFTEEKLVKYLTELDKYSGNYSAENYKVIFKEMLERIRNDIK